MITFLGKRRWIGEKGKINVKKKNKRRKSQATAKWLNTPSQRQFQFSTSPNYFDSPLFYNFLVLYLRSAILNRRSITTAIKCGSALLPSSVLDEARTSVQHLLFFVFFCFSDFLILFFTVCFIWTARDRPQKTKAEFLVERQLCVQCEMERMFKRLNILVNTIHSALVCK